MLRRMFLNFVVHEVVLFLWDVRLDHDGVEELLHGVRVPLVDGQGLEKGRVHAAS